ncbi:MAG: methionine adenosyltransferase [SAR202 cluster bacterium]|nr:methionine adenosyltransferase [SAR202 cluster bacterium]|tara:strand:+ start:21725 stop:22942 length:1218 start_codon:yes stop_codon:yes gene_type:complete
MTFSFTESESYLYTSESVTEGHPDKLCDQISDAILDAFISQDPNARVACEVSTTTGLIVVIGEVTINKGYVDVPEIVRNTIKKIGYTNPEFGFDYKSTGVLVSIDKQSEDIAGGVDVSLEARSQENTATDPLDTLGAGDQGMMVGFACNETPELMPLSISLAHKLCKKMSDVRKNGNVPFLRPDGKAQVTIEYSRGKPKRVHTVVLSTQHDPDVSQDKIETALFEKVVNEVLPKTLIDDDTIYHINPSGRFVIGGPVGDAGLTGRKIIVDTYGGVARHGGGAFSGKDPTKVDRSAAYAARQVAKTIVAANLADRAEIQLSYAIGVSKPISISVETFGTNKIPDEQIIDVVNRHFDLRPGAIINDLNLKRPIYSQTAAYGHFGRSDLDLPWENIDKAKIIMDEILN